jgi:hypothetical protein
MANRLIYDIKLTFAEYAADMRPLEYLETELHLLAPTKSIPACLIVPEHAEAPGRSPRRFALDASLNCRAADDCGQSHRYQFDENYNEESRSNDRADNRYAEHCPKE